MANILVLDDDQILLAIIRHALQRAGHTVITSLSGENADRTLKQVQVDLLITDLFMPDREGLETIQQVRRIYPNLPIIAITAGVAGHLEVFLNMAKEMGATATLNKPFTGYELQSVVEQVLTKRKI